MIKLADTKKKYSTDEYALSQFNDLFDNVTSYVKEFDLFWDEMLPQAIKIHNKYGMGEWAGSGCVDYNEAKVIYILTRTVAPKVILELGYAGGVSSCFFARALEMNNFGKLYTVDLSSEHWDVCDMFKAYREQEIILQYHSTDAKDFVKNTEIVPEITFTDLSHAYDLSYDVATILKLRWSGSIHLYHEWGMSTVSNELEKSYVSMVDQINKQFERNAFQDVFGSDFLHGGFVGSCGLGIVTPP